MYEWAKAGYITLHYEISASMPAHIYTKTFTDVSTGRWLVG